MRKRIIKTLLSAAISGGLLYCILFSFDRHTVITAISEAEPIGLGVAFFTIVFAYFIRAYRWRIWQGDLSIRESFDLLMVGYMGNNLFPARLGEVLRAYGTARKTGEGSGGTAALGSVAVEKVLDGLMVSFIGLLGIFLVPAGDALFHLLWVISALCGMMTFFVLLCIRHHGRIRTLFERFREIFPGHLTRFSIEKINFFLDGLTLIKPLDKLVRALALSGIIWALELFAYGLIGRSVWPEYPLRASLIFLPAVNFAALFPFVIGGIGTIEGAATFFLSNVGIPRDHALAMVLIQHGFQLSFTVICGAAVYFIHGYFDPSRHREEGNPASPQSDPVDQPQSLINDALLELRDFSETFDLEAVPEKRIDISFVIPAYNEQNRLPKTILETLAWCSGRYREYEILVLDDGSRDHTLEIAKLFSRQVPNVRYIACPHQGKGASVKMGMLNAAGKYVLFMDADGATPLSEIPKILLPIRHGADVAIGSRVVQYPNETSVATSTHRRIIGRTFSVLVNVLATPGIGDTQCGFKAFHHRVVRPIFTRQKIDGFAFDVEILFIARKLGLSIAEIPVNWADQAGSKVNILTDSAKMLFDVIRIRWHHKHETWEEEGLKGSHGKEFNQNQENSGNVEPYHSDIDLNRQLPRG